MSKRTTEYTINTNQQSFLRDKAITGAKKYQQYLMGKKFLIVCDDMTSNEVVFYKRDFLHLTGIHSDLSDNRFFENCVAEPSTLSENNILQNQHYNYSTLKGKAKKIEIIDKIIYGKTENSLFMINLHTGTRDYPVGIRNSDINTCVGFIDGDNHARTLRKYSNSTICSSEKKINAIFSKQVSENKYDTIIYINDSLNESFPDSISKYFSEDLQKQIESIIESTT